MVITVARSYRFPNAYAQGEWLLTWTHGFVKRGLPGTLAEPLFRYKSPEEIRQVLSTLALLVLVAECAVCASAFASILRSQRRTKGLGKGLPQAHIVAAILVFATSPFFVLAGHTTGYFDSIVVLCTFALLSAVHARLTWLIPPLVLAGVATHEIFLVFGLPVVCLAIVMEDLGPARSWRRLAIDLSCAVVPAVAFYVYSLLSQQRLDDSSLAALTEHLDAYQVLGWQGVQNALFQVRTDLATSSALQHPGTFSDRLFRSGVNRVVLLPAAALFLESSLLLWRRKRAILIGPLLLVILAPRLLHLVASDTSRIASFSILQAFAAFFAISRATCAPVPSAETAGVGAGASRWQRLSTLGPELLTVLFSLVACYRNVSEDVPLMDGRVDGDGILAVRSEPACPTFQGCKPVFGNSNFEAGDLGGWTVTGDAFSTRSSFKVPLDSSGYRTCTEGSFWAGSWVAEKSDDGAFVGDDATGRLDSPPFEITSDELIFLVAGGKHPQTTAVVVSVNGREIARVWGRNSDAMGPRRVNLRRYEGQTATISLIDESTGPWGHLDADAFCWAGPT
jgi:hypothetical protein